MKTGILFFLLFGFSCFSESQGSLLFENGKSKCFIAIDESAGPVIKTAAAELQFYLGKMGGDKVDIVKIPSCPNVTLQEFVNEHQAILLGDNIYTRQAGLNPTMLPGDGFRLKTIPFALIIAGNDDNFFDYNYDWAPGSAGTLYGVYYFLEKLGCRWYLPIKIGEIIPATPDIRIQPMDISKAPYFEYRFKTNHYKWRRHTGYGGTVDPWSTRHTFTQTIDFAKKYGKTHPEYFSQGTGGIALRHSGVTAAITREAITFFTDPKRLAGKKYFAVNPVDSWTGCQCELCKKLETAERGEKGILSDYVGEAVLEVAKKLKEKNINYPIVYCAYEKYLLPPLNINRFPDNVVVLFAGGARYSPDANINNKAWNIIEQWGELQPRRFYFNFYSQFLCKLTPSFVPHLIDRDIKKMKLFRESGKLFIGGEMDFGALDEKHPYLWWFALNEYVTGKLLWDPDRNVDEILDDFYINFFGPSASVPMKKFFTRLEELYMNDKECYMYSLKTLDELDALLKEAAIAGKTTEYASRIKYIDNAFDSLRCIRRKIKSEDCVSDKAEPILYISGNSLPLKDECSGQLLKTAGVNLVDGVNGLAMEFSGDNSFVQLPSIQMKHTDYSIEMWIKPSDGIAVKKQYLLGSEAYDRHVLLIAKGELVLQHRIPASSYAGSIIRFAVPNIDIPTGSWTYVAATFSNNDGMSIYINGKLSAIDIVQNKPPELTSIMYLLGAAGHSGITDLTGFWKGSIDEVKIYRRELSATEINNNFNKILKLRE